MKTEQTKKQEIVLFPKVEKSETGSNSVRIVCRVLRRKDNSLRNILDSDHDIKKYADLVVRAYVWEKGRNNSCDVEYQDVFSIDYQRARLMSETLRKTLNKLSKMTEMQGYCQTTYDAIGRACKALGIKTIAKEVSGNGANYDDNEYRFLSIPSGLCWIEQQVETVRENAQLT